MKPTHWLTFLIALILGIALGLAYGWYIDPVEYTDTTPDTLRSDYKTDYVLMIAETYRLNPDPAFAARQLAIFGAQTPSAIATQALDNARANNYAQADLTLLQELVTAMQAWSGIK